MKRSKPPRGPRRDRKKPERSASSPRSRRTRHPNARSLEMASLYVLGSLAPAEARKFERHIRGEGEPACVPCARTERELRECVALVALGTAAGAPPPPPALRDRLLRQVGGKVSAPARRPGAPDKSSIQVWKNWKQAETEVEGSLEIRRRDDGGWQDIGRPGVRVRPLHVDAERRYVTMLVRMEPGTSYPSHAHAGKEECYVLEGDLEVAGETLHAGDYQVAPGGSLHGLQSTSNGCLLLIVSSQDDELLPGQGPAQK